MTFIQDRGRALFIVYKNMQQHALRTHTATRKPESTVTWRPALHAHMTTSTFTYSTLPSTANHTLSVADSGTASPPPPTSFVMCVGLCARRGTRVSSLFVPGGASRVTVGCAFSSPP